MISPQNLVLIGMKSSGKTTTGKILARTLGQQFTDMDAEIEARHAAEKNERLPFREIFQRHGKEYFRTLETAALVALAAATNRPPFVLATGGGLPLAEENRPLLKRIGTLVYLDVDPSVLLARIVAGGIPAFFPYPNDPQRSFTEILAARRPIYAGLASLTVPCGNEPADVIADQIIRQLEQRPREH